MPALLTRMSTPPNSATTAATPALHLLFAADVHRDAHRDAAVGDDFLGGRRVGRLLVQVGDRDLGAFAREDERDVLADAAGGAGDDGGFVLQFHDFLLSGSR